MNSRGTSEIRRRARAVGLFLCALAVAIAGAPLASAQSFLTDAFIDPVDGAFDASDWLLNKRGFLPVPIIVTEPAVGYGGGAAVLFFHRTAQDKESAKEDPDAPLGLPPSVSFAFGMGTETKTWGAGGGHFGTWRNDQYRTLTAGGYFSANVDYYLGDVNLPYNIEGFLVSHEFLVRLLRSDFFLGSRYRYVSLDPSFRTTLPPLPPPIEDALSLDSDANSGLSVIAAYDDRDNIFTPNRGVNARVYSTFWREWMGGDHDFELVETSITGYYPFFDEKLVVGANFGADFAFGDAPFYMQPYVKLRGVPSLRYQDEQAGQGEIELRWRVWQRFSLIGFAGLGWINGRKSNTDLPPPLDELETDPGAIPAGGVGFRYLMARLMGLHTGVDFAWSEDTFAFYIQTGSAW